VGTKTGPARVVVKTVVVALLIVAVECMALEIVEGIAAAAVVGEGAQVEVPRTGFFGEEGSPCILDG